MEDLPISMAKIPVKLEIIPNFLFRMVGVMTKTL